MSQEKYALTSYEEKTAIFSRNVFDAIDKFRTEARKLGL